MIKSFLLFLLCLPVLAQTTTGGCAEYFDSTTSAGSSNTWSIASTGPTVSWWTTGEIPSIKLIPDAISGAGQANIPCNVGSGNFTVSADLYTQTNFKDNVDETAGAFFLSTGQPGSLTSSDSSIVFAVTQNGMAASFRQGEIEGFGPNGFAGNNTMPGTLLGPANMQLGSGNAFDLSFTWPQASDSAPIPYWRYTVKATRVGNVLTFYIYTDQYQKGLVPYFTTSYTMTSHLSDSFQYIGGITMNGNTSAPYRPTLQISNIRAWGGASFTEPTITSIIPSSGSTTFQSGNQVTITGTSFTNASSYSLRIGQASSVATVTPTYVNGTSLTATLPTETNGKVYAVHLIRNRIDTEYYPGILYSVPVVTSIVPFEVPSSPVNNADATVQIYGAGLDPTSTVVVGGNSATVTYIDPTHISAVIPSGTQGTPSLVITSSSGATTVYNSATSGTYPPSGKLDFGYASHPFLQFTSTGSPSCTGSCATTVPTLTSIQAKSTDPNFAPYFQDLNSLLASGNQGLFGYGYDYILTGNTSSYTTYQSMLASESGNDNNLINGVGEGLPTGELNRIQYSFFGFQTGLGNNAMHMAVFYDAFFQSMTPTVRSQYQEYLKHALSAYSYLYATGDNNTKTGAFFSNRIAIANSGAGMSALSLVNSIQSLYGYALYNTPQNPPYTSTTGLAEITKAVTQDKNWANYSWLPDGKYVEESQYANYGSFAYALLGRSLNNAVALGVPTITSDQSIFNTNYQYFGTGNWVSQVWDGVVWANYGDTVPIDVLRNTMIETGLRYNNSNLLYMADYITTQVNNKTGPYAITGLNSNAETKESGTYVYGGPYSIIWRPSSTFPSHFTGFPTTVVSTSGQQAALRSDASINTPFYIGIKGSGNHEVGSNQHHHVDQGSFVVQYKGEEFLIDPGYYRNFLTNHSLMKVDGLYPGNLNTSTASIVDNTVSGSGVAYSTPLWRAAAVDATAAYTTNNTNIVRAIRNFAMYANGANRIAFALDDFSTSGAGAIVSQFQSGKAVTLNGTSGFTMLGAQSNLIATFNGPTVTALNNFDTTSSANRAAYSLASYSTGSPYSGVPWTYAMLSGSNTSRPLNGQANGTNTAGWAKSMNVYTAGTTYITDDTAASGNLVWISLVDANQGNTPGVDPTKWKSLGPSSVFYNQLTASYTASSANPMITVLAPANTDSSGALTASIDRSVAGTITITVSDGAIIQYVQTAGVWKLNSTSSPATDTAYIVDHPDRRPIMADFLTNHSNSTSSNPRGYNFATSYTIGTDNGTYDAFRTLAVAHANSVVTLMQARPVQPQGIIIWDIEGQEFVQAVSYVGDPRFLGTGYAPEMDAAADAMIGVYQSARYAVGLTIRPQQILVVSALPSTCTYNSINDFNSYYVVKGAAFGNKFYSCNSDGVSFTLSPVGFVGGPTDAGGQAFFQQDASVVSNEVALLSAKVNYARTRWGIRLFYVDTSVYHATGVIADAIYHQLASAFPDTLFIPEQHNTQYYGSTMPYSEPKGVPADPSLPGTGSRAAYPLGTIAVNLSNCAGDLSCWTPRLADFTSGQVIGDIPIYSQPQQLSVAQLTRIESMISAGIAQASTVTVTDSSTSRVFPFAGSPAGVYNYPLKMRVYFAASDPALSSSTTYCEAGQDQGQNTCSINLAGLSRSQIRYYDHQNSLKITNSPVGITAAVVSSYFQGVYPQGIIIH